MGSMDLTVHEAVTGYGESLALAEYKYAVADALSGHEIFAYHLHPGKVFAPHLHLGAGAGSLAAPLYKAHFPTAGPVELTGLFRLLIEDFGVRPLRADWAVVLDENPGGHG